MGCNGTKGGNSARALSGLQAQNKGKSLAYQVEDGKEAKHSLQKTQGLGGGINTELALLEERRSVLEAPMEL